MSDVAESDVADVIVASWRTVLDVPAVADDDDFFELGGNSIMVTRIVSYLRRELGVEVDMLQVWDTPSFGEFRAVVQAQLSEGAT
jgi:acyl carrier protein